MNDNYFERIDTKEKAYWLGFLYADGCVNIDKRNNAKRLMINLSIKDEIVIDRFLEAIQSNAKKTNEATKTRIIIGSNQMCNDLIKYGCLPRKSKIIELPRLDSRELYIAFLLGFYDGDGTQNKTVITCGSVKFLEQIKEMFHLPFKIQINEHDGYIEGNRSIHGTGYYMCIGAELFNKMMDNYTNSLLRKRRRFCTNEEKATRAANASRIDQKGKLTITKEILQQLVWEKPSIEIARELDVSDSAIAKRCKKLGIKKPGPGYWAKQHAISVE
jgi:hypothetical protein